MTDLIRQAEETLPENWGDIDVLVHQSRDDERNAILDIQLRKLKEYEDTLEIKLPVKRGKVCVYKKEVILKRQKRQWK